MARRGPTRFYSKAQWRWAFASHKTWARRQARRTPGPPKIRFDRLPARTGAPGARTVIRG